MHVKMANPGPPSALVRRPIARWSCGIAAIPVTEAGFDSLVEALEKALNDRGSFRHQKATGLEDADRPRPAPHQGLVRTDHLDRRDVGTIYLDPQAHYPVRRRVLLPPKKQANCSNGTSSATSGPTSRNWTSAEAFDARSRGGASPEVCSVGSTQGAISAEPDLVAALNCHSGEGLRQSRSLGSFRIITVRAESRTTRFDGQGIWGLLTDRLEKFAGEIELRSGTVA